MRGARGQGPGTSLLLRWAARPILAAAALPAAFAAILPDQIGEFRCGLASVPAPPDPALYAEFGLRAAEQVTCTAGKKKFTVQAWRTQDSTGALALFQARRPADAAPSTLKELAAQTGPDGLLLGTQNYVLQFAGRIPTAEEIEALSASLPQKDHSSLPTLAGFLPAEDLIPNSQRYILGPVSLQRFEPRIAPSLAAFSLGAEAQLGRYRTPAGELTMVILNYPTPSMARERQAEFLKQPDVLAKRAGPLVAVVVQPPDADAAEQILGRVQYIAGITWGQVDSEKKDANMANLIVTGFLLAAVIVGASLLAGIWLGGFRAILRRLGWRTNHESMTVLRIHDK